MKERIWADFARKVEERNLKIEKLRVYVEDELVFSQDWKEGDTPRNIYSNTKTFVTTLLGKYIAEGAISLDTRVVDLMADKLPAEGNPGVEKIKLRHLLTMSSGFGQTLMGVDRRRGVGFPDPMKWLLSQPVKCEPGTSFTYSTGDTILAGRMLERATGKNLAVMMYEDLLQPMGIELPMWECCPQGHPIAGGGMFLKVEEQARLGLLHLHKGNWEGQQLVPAEWIAEMGKKQIEIPPANIWRCGYGYQVWLCPYPDSYRADGMFGQITVILPKQQAVIAYQCPEVGNDALVRDAIHEAICEMIAE